MGTTWLKVWAWARAFWPVVASSTRIVRFCQSGGLAVDHPADLAELGHQVVLGVEAAGGVDDQLVDLARLGRVDGVVDHGARVGALALADDLDAQALAPERELLDGGGAEGVARGEHHPLALLLVRAWRAWRSRSSCPRR